MTSFVHTHYPNQHPGAERLETVAQRIAKGVSKFDSARSLAALLLAAIVSAVLVVANQVIETVSDGHLLAAWMALWLVAFAAMALFATPARHAAAALRSAMHQWAMQRNVDRADEKLWDVALGDARVMADISHAMTRDAQRDVRGYF